MKGIVFGILKCPLKGQNMDEWKEWIVNFSGSVLEGFFFIEVEEGGERNNTRDVLPWGVMEPRYMQQRIMTIPKMTQMNTKSYLSPNIENSLHVEKRRLTKSV